jgi:hypothetical protein
MLRKLLITGILGIGTIVSLTATPSTAEAGYCRPARVVYHRGYRHVRYVAPRVVYSAPVVVNPCPAPLIINGTTVVRPCP